MTLRTKPTALANLRLSLVIALGTLAWVGVVLGLHAILDATAMIGRLLHLPGWG